MADHAGSYLAGVRSGQGLVEPAIEAFDRARNYRDRLAQQAQAHTEAATALKVEADRHAETMGIEREKIGIERTRADAYNKEQAALAGEHKIEGDAKALKEGLDIIEITPARAKLFPHLASLQGEKLSAKMYQELAYPTQKGGGRTPTLLPGQDLAAYEKRIKESTSLLAQIQANPKEFSPKELSDARDEVRRLQVERNTKQKIYEDAAAGITAKPVVSDPPPDPGWKPRVMMLGGKKIHETSHGVWADENGQAVPK